MKNLNYISCNEIEEFELIRDSKHKATKTKLVALQSLIEQDYNKYLDEFDDIHQIGPSHYSDDNASALKSCYTSKTKAKNDLIKRIIDAQTLEFQAICPYCLYHSRTTIDHYIPKESYPVYSVLSKNLIPCCSPCNEFKGESWRTDTGRVFIHFYNDEIPNVNFLSARLQFINSYPTIFFSVFHAAELSLNQYSKLRSHFNKLKLLDTYSLYGVPTLISDTKIDIQSNEIANNTKYSRTIKKNILFEKARLLKSLYGLNYWRAVALESLANSDHFIDSL